MGFVGYRDFSDKNNQFVLKNFTPYIENIKDLLNGIQATGGGDRAEDIIGAFKKAQQFTHKDGILQIFLICDAPSHGKAYYD